MLIHHPCIPAERRDIHRRPVEGGWPGTFFALRDAHDLPPGPLAGGDVTAMLRWGELWWQDASDPGNWIKVGDVARVKNVRTRAIMASIDRANGMTNNFMPEFFFQPRGWRGKRMVRRAINRAHRRVWK